MNSELDAKRLAIERITMLMLLFLPLSTVANYINDRDSFAILYIFAFIATLKHLYCYYHKRDLYIASESILLILFGTFFAFALFGDQSSFDLFWVLVLPMVAMMTASLSRLRVWITRFMILLILVLATAHTAPQFVGYDTFALWSLLWAGVFISGLALHYKKTQQILMDQIASYQHDLETKIEESVGEIKTLNDELDATQIEILERLGTLGEYRSNETGLHVKRVSLYARELALLIGLDEEEATIIERAAPLHDIGKVGIEDAILNKPGTLTEMEYEHIKEHTLIGESILTGSHKPLLQRAAEIAGGHHEHFDGQGYPRALQGEHIPLSARIVALVDVFDALCSKRVYKEQWDYDAVRAYIISESGKHFDPKLAAVFVENFQDFTTIFEANHSTH